MGTMNLGGETHPYGQVFLENQEESLNTDGHQSWHRLILHSFNDGERFEALIHKYETWSQPSDQPELEFRGVRGEGDLEKN